MWTFKKTEKNISVPTISAPIGPPVTISFGGVPKYDGIESPPSGPVSKEKGVGIKKRIMQFNARVQSGQNLSSYDSPKESQRVNYVRNSAEHATIRSRVATLPPMSTTFLASLHEQPLATAGRFEDGIYTGQSNLRNDEYASATLPHTRSISETDELRRRLEASEVANAELQSTKLRLTDRIAELEHSLFDESSAAQRLGANLERESRERERLKAEIRNLQQQLLQQKTAQSKSAQDDYPNRQNNAEAEAELNKMTLELERLRDDMATLREHKQSLKLKNEETAEKLLDVQADANNLRARNEHLEKRHKELNAEAKTAKEQLAEVGEQKAQLEKDRAKLEFSAKDRDLQLQTLKSENAELRKSLNKTRSELDELLDANLVRTDSAAAALSAADDDGELAAARKARRDLEAKLAEMESELEDALLRNQSFEQTSARLEASVERLRADLQREADGKETEIAELRAQFQRRTRTFEDEVAELGDANASLLKQNRMLESRVRQMDTQSQASSVDLGGSALYYKRELRKALSLLRDTQTVLAHERECASNNTVMRQLREQVEDAENAKLASLRTRHMLENEISDLRSQLDTANAAKCAADEKVLAIMRDKNAVNTLAQEHDEQLQELLKKHKALIQQAHVDALTLADQTEQIAKLERANQKLQEQLNEAAVNVEFNKLHTVEKHKVQLVQLKLRDLQAKLDLELSHKLRFESIIAKLKEEIESLQEQLLEAKSARDRDAETLWKSKKDQKMLQEEINDLKKREGDLLHRYKSTKATCEQLTDQHEKTQSDLRLALKRVDALQATLNANLTAGSDIEEEDERDDDDVVDEQDTRDDGGTGDTLNGDSLGKPVVDDRSAAYYTDDEAHGRRGELNNNNSDVQSVC